MPLFEIDDNKVLVPFRQLRGGRELYESLIEDLLWENLDEFTGDTLFPVARQASLTNGGRPDVVALNQKADVVVIEAKRDLDRRQLAQCLEYAGWARTTSLDELSGLYQGGPAAFFTDWQEFTESATPLTLSKTPFLVLVAGDFHGRTESALDFLRENGLPVEVITVAIYEDQAGRRFLDVGSDYEPELGGETAEPRVAHTKRSGKRVRMADLLDAELIEPGEQLRWDRPRLGESYTATVLGNGSIELEDGRSFSSPSRAAKEAANIVAYDGWHAWHVPRLDRTPLNELRNELIKRQNSAAMAPPSAD